MYHVPHQQQQQLPSYQHHHQTRTRALYKTLLLAIADWARTTHPSDFLSTHHHYDYQQPGLQIQNQQPYRNMSHATSSSSPPDPPCQTTEAETLNQVHEESTVCECEANTTYANARVLEEGLVGEKGGQDVEENEEDDTDDDTEDHPNLSLEWTWTVLRR